MTTTRLSRLEMLQNASSECTAAADRFRLAVEALGEYASEPDADEGLGDDAFMAVVEATCDLYAGLVQAEEVTHHMTYLKINSGTPIGRRRGLKRKLDPPALGSGVKLSVVGSK